MFRIFCCEFHIIRIIEINRTVALVILINVDVKSLKLEVENDRR